MSEIQTQQENQMDTATVEAVMLGGDLSKLSPAQRLSYYKNLCESLGLNPLTKPFAYISLNQKLTLYAQRDCTDQIRNNKGVSIITLDGKKIDDLYIVTATGKDKTGRCDAATGAVNTKDLKGEALANAIMKAETKAKRRLTLSLCGLGILDDSEVDSVPGAKREDEASISVTNKAVESAPYPVSVPDEPKVEVLPPEPKATKEPEKLRDFRLALELCNTKDERAALWGKFKAENETDGALKNAALAIKKEIDGRPA